MHPIIPISNNLLPTVPRRYFCCDFSVLHVVMHVCMWSPSICLPQKELSIMPPIKFCFVIKIENR